MELWWPPVNPGFMTQKQDAARLGPGWLWRRSRLWLFCLTELSVHRPRAPGTKRETGGESHAAHYGKNPKEFYFKWKEVLLTMILNPSDHQRSLLNTRISLSSTHCVPFKRNPEDDLEVSLVPCFFHEADRIFVVWVQVCQFALAYHLPGYQENVPEEEGKEKKNGASSWSLSLHQEHESAVWRWQGWGWSMPGIWHSL